MPQNDLISRSALLEKIYEQGHKNPNAYRTTRYAELLALEAPAVERPKGRCVRHDPDPVTMDAWHRRWFGKGMSRQSIFWTCSECDGWINSCNNFCPNCGAKMDGGAEDG